MTYKLSGLTVDVLPRLIDAPKKGISIIQAANSIQNMIHKRLLSRSSDLIAKGDLELEIGAMGYYGTLPTDFIAMAERPYAEEIYTDWMAGTVTSYNSTTGALVANITDSSGSDELDEWNIATAALPYLPSEVIGTSTSTVTVGIGSQSLTITTGLSLVAGDYVLIFPTTLPDTLTPQYHYLEPEYLTEDDEEHERTWWEWYGRYGSSIEPPGLRPRRFKVIDDTLYVRPKVIMSVTIKGKYFQSPTLLTSPSDTIPYRGMFDEIFREGVVKIIMSGSLLDADANFERSIHNQVDSVINARIHLLPKTRRMKRENFI